MKALKSVGITGGMALAVGLAPQAFAVALPLVIDDFGGGPDTVSLISLAPPQTATGSFAYAGAVGGWRDVFVQSTSKGIYASGVAFGSGGYASFAGTGDGGIVYDGSPGLAGVPPIWPDTFTLGYKLFEDCPTPLIHLSASADLAGSSINVYLFNDAGDYGIYTIAIAGGNVPADYFAPVLTPTATVGAYDPMAAINAFELFFNGTAVADTDLNVGAFEITCVPESGTWMAMAGLGGLMGLTWRRMRLARAK
jgi:hypothetical protein